MPKNFDSQRLGGVSDFGGVDSRVFAGAGDWSFVPQDPRQECLSYILSLTRELSSFGKEGERE
jgi:hypothetical protein